ncbi:MAG: 16S rRNA (cytosine(1402)-N(4))-methyltransferase [Gammaproteobacteria bacterium HGW-Gammaproteobacteria-3]|nr:MAG: 16S rRNA (cytosine(1402)-N(4))-methyltransferase [Gammaproteobacteria bacterium HGW-Gammaproteobacteria-3]
MQHLPVLFAEALEALAIKKTGIYLDATFGRGGHSRGILHHLGPSGRLLAFDRDIEAINSADASALTDDKRLTLVHACFSQMEALVAQAGLLGQIDGVLMDLGVSSPQLDDAGRGFSFLQDGPLDMRMAGEGAGATAAQWLAQVSEQDLVKVLFAYGEERFARRIAAAIVRCRGETPLVSTRQLAALIADAVPFKEKHKHPATRSFQAIRIEINRELEELEQGLAQAVKLLKPGGRLVVISFHSLEDRIVKRFIRAESGAKYDPGRLPVKESDIDKGMLKKLGKAIKASAGEIAHNPRARSAVMRVAQRL